MAVENRERGNAYILAESPSAHMSVLVVARIAGLVVDETLEGRRAAAGSVFHGSIWTDICARFCF